MREKNRKANILKYLYAGLLLLAGCAAIFLAHDKGVWLLLFGLIFAGVAYFNKSIAIASFLAVVTMIPFNVVFRIGELSIVKEFYAPYVNGVYVNYLALDLHIGHVLALPLVLFGVNEILMKRDRSWLYWLGLPIGIFVLHNVVHLDLSVLWVSMNLIWVWLFGVGVWLFFGRYGVDVHAKVIVWLLLIGLGMNVGVGVLQVIGGGDVGFALLGEPNIASGLPGVATVVIDGTMVLRGYGFFPHPNILAGFALMVSLTTIAMRERALVGQYVTSIATCLSVCAMLLTFSFSGLLALSAMGLLYVSRGILSKANMKRVNLNSILTPYLAKLSGASLNERLDLMRNGFEIFLLNPWTGLGAGGSVNLGEMRVLDGAGRVLYQPIHNIFMIFYLEYGFLIGTVIVFAMIAYFAVHIMESRTRFVATSVLSSVLIIGSLDHYFLTLSQGRYLFAIIMLLPIIVMRQSKQDLQVLD